VRYNHRVSTSRRKWYPPAAANAYGRHAPVWLLVLDVQSSDYITPVLR